ncbi:MAG: hypothetical protein CMM45_02365 [Rhodospirillaceae bacterium]|nr:hypothetical protein [Rhodospirillaceae bacterium]
MTDKFKQAQCLHKAGRFAEAQDLYVQVVNDNPYDAEALYLLGTLLAQGGRFNKAEVFLRRAVQESPRNSVYHCNLGVTLQNLSQLDRAKGCFQRALKLDRENVDAYYNLAKLYKQLNHIDEALLAYEQAVSLDPNRFDALINMANILVDQGRLRDAITCFDRAAKVNPSSDRPLINLGNTYRRMGLAEKAINAYDAALRVRHNDGLRIKQALTLPTVYQSLDHIDYCRTSLKTQVGELLKDELNIGDPSLETSTTNFFLAYQNRNNRDLQQSIAQLHLLSCPTLSWTAPHCEGQPVRNPGKVRVGFLSTYFRRHSIGRMMIGFITQLPKDEFEIVVITTRGKGDLISRAIEAAADDLLYLPQSFFDAQKTIGELKLDLLFFADIGMDVRTYFLAFARMAPVQCVTWGHPDTTGIPNVDYFVSGEQIEPQDGVEHYSEKLYQLPAPPTYYPFPEIPDGLKVRADFAISQTRTFYLCPQSAVKFHPDIDQLFAGVLRNDDDADIYVVEGAVGHWTEQLRERWRVTIPDVAARIFVLPRQTPEDFLALQSAADVILDTPHFSGGNTSYEAFAMAKPIVTLDSAFMRGRVTSGLYRLMEITELTASSLEEYVAIAVRLGKERDYNLALSRRIGERRDILYGRQDVVDGFAEFAHSVAHKAGAK